MGNVWDIKGRYKAVMNNEFLAAERGQRGVLAGSSPGSNVIEYITISTTGDVTDFGDLTATASAAQGHGNATRGLIGLGSTGSPAASSDIIEYITIMSTGNSADFGNLSDARHATGATGNSTRAIFGGGSDADTANLNVIDSVEMASTLQLPQQEMLQILVI